MRYLPVFTFKGLNAGVWQTVDVRNNCLVVEEYEKRQDAITMAGLLNETSINLEQTMYKTA